MIPRPPISTRTDTRVPHSSLFRSIGKDQNAATLTREHLTALRAVPGVTAGGATNQVPLGRSSWNNGISLSPEQTESTLNATTYMDRDRKSTRLNSNH